MTTSRSPRTARAFAFAALAVASLVLVSCGSEDATSPDNTSVEDTIVNDGFARPEDSGQQVERFNDPTEPIEVAKGQVFEIALPADAEACFSWNLDMPQGGVVSLVTSRPSAVGAPGEPEALTAESNTDIYEFGAVTSGQTDLRFEEISPCEPGTTRDTRTVTVVVTGS
jgi:predicted secreted protein